MENVYWKASMYDEPCQRFTVEECEGECPQALASGVYSFYGNEKSGTFAVRGTKDEAVEAMRNHIMRKIEKAQKYVDELRDVLKLASSDGANSVPGDELREEGSKSLAEYDFDKIHESISAKNNTDSYEWGIDDTVKWIYQNMALDEPFPEKAMKSELLGNADNRLQVSKSDRNKNLFEGAKFKDLYLTRDGRAAFFLECYALDELLLVDLVTEDKIIITVAYDSGLIDFETGYMQDKDVVSRHSKDMAFPVEKHIDEKKLRKLAYNILGPGDEEDIEEFEASLWTTNDLVNAFRDGFMLT